MVDLITHIPKPATWTSRFWRCGPAEPDKLWVWRWGPPPHAEILDAHPPPPSFELKPTLQKFQKQLKHQSQTSSIPTIHPRPPIAHTHNHGRRTEKAARAAHGRVVVVARRPALHDGSQSLPFVPRRHLSARSVHQHQAGHWPLHQGALGGAEDGVRGAAGQGAAEVWLRV